MYHNVRNDIIYCNKATDNMVFNLYRIFYLIYCCASEQNNIMF